MNALGLLVLASLSAAADLRELLTRTTEDRRSREQLVSELARVDVSERPALVRLALGNGLAPLLAKVPEGGWILPPEVLPGVAGDALARLSGGVACELLAAELVRDPAPAARRAALRLLPRFESTGCAELTWALIGQLDELTLASRGVREEARRALVSAFASDGAGASRALAGLAELPLARAELLLEVAGQSGRAELAPDLAAALSAPQSPLFRSALGALAELERRVPWRLAGEARTAFEAASTWLDDAQQAELLHLLVVCEDPELAPWLDELARSSDARTARLALSALGLLTRSQTSAEPEARTAWLERELAWFDARAEELAHEFGSDDPGRAVAALHECLRHPLFRRDLAARLADELVDARPEAALAALPALLAWGSHAAVPGLELALEAQDEAVRDLARETLTLLLDAPLETQ